MSTEHDFTAVFGHRRGLVAPYLKLESHHEWIRRLINHFHAASDGYIRALAHVAVSDEDFCLWVSSEAAEIAWGRFPRQTQTMVDDLDRALGGRLSRLGSNASCPGVALELAFCMIARDGLSSDQIDIARSVLWGTSPRLDRQLGQRPLRDW